MADYDHVDVAAIKEVLWPLFEFSTSIRVYSTASRSVWRYVPAKCFLSIVFFCSCYNRPLVRSWRQLWTA